MHPNFIIDIDIQEEGKKAENMMHFLSQNHNSLSSLSGDNIVLPLNDLKSKVEERIHPTND